MTPLQRCLAVLQRCLAVLNGEVPPHFPVVPEAFMFAAAACGHRIGRINRPPDFLANNDEVASVDEGAPVLTTLRRATIACIRASQIQIVRNQI